MNFGIDVSQGKTDFNTAFNNALALGVNFMPLHLTLDQFNGGSAAPGYQWCRTAAAYYSQFKVKIGLTINPIETLKKTLPAGCTGFDDRRTLSTVRSIMLNVLSIFPREMVLYICFGSEIDVYLNNNTYEWGPFYNLLQYVRSSIHTANPSSTFFTEFTAHTLLNMPKNRLSQQGITKCIQLLNSNIGISYYPLKDDYTMKSSIEYQSDMKTLLTLFPGATFSQVGAPSSPVLSSSEVQQSDFLKYMRSLSTLRTLMVCWLCDMTPEDVDVIATFYNANNTPFREFIGSLGIMDAFGAPKAAYSNLKTTP
jgi:hypothetical protein